MAEKSQGPQGQEIRIKDAVQILCTLPEWWKRRVSGKAKEYVVEQEVLNRLKRAGLVETTNGEFNEYRQTRLGAELVEMYTNPYYYGNEGAPLSQQDLSEWETWRKKSSNATGSTSSTATS